MYTSLFPLYIIVFDILYFVVCVNFLDRHIINLVLLFKPGVKETSGTNMGDWKNKCCIEVHAHGHRRNILLYVTQIYVQDKYTITCISVVAIRHKYTLIIRECYEQLLIFSLVLLHDTDCPNICILLVNKKVIFSFRIHNLKLARAVLCLPSKPIEW
jgi:hypothetical protein